MAENEQQIRGKAQEGAISNDRKWINASLVTNLTILTVAGFAFFLGENVVAIPLGLAGSILVALGLLLGLVDKKR